MCRALAASAIVAAVLSQTMLCGSAALAASDEAVFELRTQRCVLKASADSHGKLLRLDVTQAQPAQTCGFDAEETVTYLSELFAALDAGDKQSRFTSLMLGQIENYSWLQRHLMDTARRDTAWSQERGKPARVHINDYVNSVLSRPAALEVFNSAGRTHGYSFTTANCEKVFVSSDGLPFNAFCWLTMAE